MDVSNWNGERGMQFLQQPGTPDHIYGLAERTAARCIYYLAPEKRVFADARLALNSREVLTDYLQLQFQLAQQSPAAEETLARYGGGQLPAIVLDNMMMLKFSVREPKLMHGLLANPGWTCVFSTVFNEIVDLSPEDLIGGVTIFLDFDSASRLGLSEISTKQLLAFAAMYRTQFTPQER